MHIAQSRTSVAAAAERLYSLGVMQHSGHGNISTRVSDERMALTATGHLADSADEQPVSIVGFDGAVVDGDLESTVAEIVPMHAAVYRARSDAGAIVHTHSPAMTAFAVANRPLPARYEPLLRRGQAADVPVAAWAPRGSEQAVGNIVRAFTDDAGVRAVLLANHGLLAIGDDPVAAASMVAILEEAAEAELAAAALGGSRSLPDAAYQQVRERLDQFAG